MKYTFLYENHINAHTKNWRMDFQCSHNLNAVRNCGRWMRNLIEIFHRLLMTTNETFDDATTQKNNFDYQSSARMFKSGKNLLIFENSLEIHDFKIIKFNHNKNLQWNLEHSFRHDFEECRPKINSRKNNRRSWYKKNYELLILFSRKSDILTKNIWPQNVKLNKLIIFLFHSIQYCIFEMAYA